ncbi:MAG: hypothetical protein ACTSVU_08965 [Promethearchaeota archaeon]
MYLTFALLIFITILKIIVVIAMGSVLILRWKRQTKHYLTDFPFLMALTFFGYGLLKIYDVFLYLYGRNMTFNELNSGYTSELAALAYIRMIFGTLSIIPYVILMLEIWFTEKKKIRNIVGVSWIVLNIIGIIFVKTYSQLLLINGFSVLAPILLSVISFIVINHNKKLAEINCLRLAWGWGIFIVLQLIRPIWRLFPSSSGWGLTWIGELLEMLALIIVGIGFLTHASYSKKIVELRPNNYKEIQSREINVDS